MIFNIQNAGQARIVASEFKRVAGNMGVVVVMAALDPTMKNQAGLAAAIIDQQIKFAETLVQAAEGLSDDQAVFLPDSLPAGVEEAFKTLQGLLG